MRSRQTTRVLHVLSQRPSRTGSGITLDALVRHAEATGRYEQCVVVGTPAEDARPGVGGLAAERIIPLSFDSAELPFSLPGMSDVMPYSSTRFSALTEEELRRYRAAWRAHLGATITRFRPELIHSHHVWLVSSLLKDVAPELPVVTHCHATGLRQRILCPELAPIVDAGCARNEHFVVLHREHASALQKLLGAERERIHVVGVGYQEDVFFAGRDLSAAAIGASATIRNERILFVGKHSAAKGLPQLIDAFESLRQRRPACELYVVGGGTGRESAALQDRLSRTAGVVVHGLVSQLELVELMRQSHVCALPSFYEGVPLVLVEAFACGCRVVATALPGVVDQLAPRLDTALELVALPRLNPQYADRPEPADLPVFVAALAAALDRSLDAPPLGDPRVSYAEPLAAFSWRSVFERVERVWQRALTGSRTVGVVRAAGALLLAVLVGAAVFSSLPSAAWARRSRRRTDWRKVWRNKTTLKKILDLAQRTTSPTFAEARPLRMMNRGTMLYLGKGMWAEQETFYLLRLSDLKTVTVRAPFAAYVRAFPSLRRDPNDTRPAHKQFHLTKLLYYDEKNREAGFEVSDAIGGKNPVRRHFLMQWNLDKKKVTQATLVARERSGQTYTHMLPLGYDYSRREFSYVRQVIGRQTAGRTIFVIGFSSRKPRVIAQFEGQRSMSGKTYFDAKRQRALLVEYAELASKGPAPRGHLIEMNSGKHLAFPIPLTTYGVAFGAAGKRVYAYSSQLGQLWAIEASTGRKLHVLRLGKFGHEINRVGSGRLLLLRNSGLRVIRLGKHMHRGRRISIKKIYKGFSHVGGSIVVPGYALIKNGDTLYVVALK